MPRSKISRKNLRKADDLRRMATKVWHYRRDVLPADQLAELEAAGAELDRVKEDPEATQSDLDAAYNRLDRILNATGGSFYPKRALSENVEMFLVAAILAIGVRTYFVQPFKIPTNSMYPTYNGMTFEVFEDPAEVPGPAERIFRLVTLGASRQAVVAPREGEVIIPLQMAPNQQFYVPFNRVQGRKWGGVLPTLLDEYTLLLDGTPIAVRVPAEFGFSKVLLERFGTPGEGQLRRAPGGAYLYHTGERVKGGESFLSYDILTGDQLFVDRFSYHFRAPEVGEPFVFRTNDIPRLGGEKYYIKRLVGTPGDSLQVVEPELLLNGKAITGADAFEYNADRAGEYEGYIPRVAWNDVAPLEQPFTVPADSYFALGDNSDESSDSRHWGVVPEKAVVGRAIFIYYPFSKRFGVAK